MYSDPAKSLLVSYFAHQVQPMSSAETRDTRLRLGPLQPSAAELDAISTLVHSLSISCNVYPVEALPSATFWRNNVWCHNGRPLALSVIGRYAADLTLRDLQAGQTHLFVVPIRRVDTTLIQDLLRNAGHLIGQLDVVIRAPILTSFRSYRSFQFLSMFRMSSSALPFQSYGPSERHFVDGFTARFAGAARP